MHILLERALMLKAKAPPDTDDLKPNDIFFTQRGGVHSFLLASQRIY